MCAFYLTDAVLYIYSHAQEITIPFKVPRFSNFSKRWNQAKEITGIKRNYPGLSGKFRNLSVSPGVPVLIQYSIFLKVIYLFPLISLEIVATLDASRENAIRR